MAISSNAVIRFFSGLPSGACSSVMLAINSATGDLYDCLAGAWHAVGGGGATTPAGVTANLQYNNGGAFGAIADGSLGKLLISQGAGNPPVFADPIVQGVDAQAAAQTSAPVLGGGRFYGDGSVRTLAMDTNGVAQMAIVGSVTLANLPQQPFLNTADFTDVVASSPTRGDIIVANSTPKYARFAVGATNTLLHGGTDPSWSAVVQADVTSGYVDLVNNQTAAGNKVFSGLTSVASLDNRIYVDGTKYPLTPAGIQQAFTDACDGTRGGPNAGTDVYLPPMTITGTNVGATGEQFLITCSLKIHGSTQYATWFIQPVGVGANVPMFHFKPTSAQSSDHMLIENIKITSGTSLGAGILFDSTTVGIAGFEVRDTLISNLAVGSFAIDFTGANNIGWGVIRDNDLSAGIRFNNPASVDSTLIEHNVFSSATGFTGACIDASTNSGAAHITVFNNNGGCSGGFFISTGTIQPKILYNQIELTSGSGSANGAAIDLMGTTFNIDGAEIRGNNINCHAACATNIRLGTTSNVKIDGNVLGEKVTTGIGILLSATATGTQLGYNEFVSTAGGALSGGQVAYSIAAAAAATTITESGDWPINKVGQADIVADSAAINTTDTIIVKTPAFPANRLIAGTTFRIILDGTCTSTVANASTFTLRWGTAGTTADGTVAALVSSVAAASGTNNGFRAVIDLTVRVPGAAATSSAFMELVSDGNIGIVATPNEKFVAGTAFNSTTAAGILSLSYKTAATTTTSTFRNATIEIVQN